MRAKNWNPSIHKDVKMKIYTVQDRLEDNRLIMIKRRFGERNQVNDAWRGEEMKIAWRERFWRNCVNCSSDTEK